MRKPVIAAIAAFTVILTAGTALADYYVIPVPTGVGKRITSVPYTIDQPGFYYLTNNLTSTGRGITIDANDVTLDLLGFTLAGPGKTSGTGEGIYIDCQSNVEVRNGTVRDFGGRGVDGTCVSYGTRLINLRSINNGGSGFYFAGTDHYFENCAAATNGSDGFTVLGAAIMVGNTARDNTDDGIDIGEGSLIKNFITGNGGYGIEASVSEVYKYLFDENWVVGNTAGAINANPASAVYGVNMGIPLP